MTAFLQLAMGPPCLNVEYIIICNQFPLPFLSLSILVEYMTYARPASLCDVLKSTAIFLCVGRL